MDIFQNLDLLSVGVTVASIGVLGFSVYFNNPRNITNTTFFFFTLATLFWGVVNYSFYQVNSFPDVSLWLLRTVLFFAVCQAFGIFQLFFVFPHGHVFLPKWYKYILIPSVVLVGVLVLSPLSLESIKEISPEGRILKVHNGPVMPIFGLMATFLVLGGIYNLLRKIKSTVSSERRPYWFILAGVVITFILIITFNLVLPAVFDNSNFVPFGALFVFPFITFTSYAIMKHKFFNIKVAGTAVLIFLLSVVTFGEVILSREFSLIVYRSGVFLLVLLFGIFLIKGVLREVQQRERLQELTKKLEDANDELQKLDKMKSEFISIASHQLRTPLTATKWALEFLAKGDKGKLNKKGKETLIDLCASNDRLIKLVNELLNVSRLEESRVRLDPKPTDVVALMKGLIHEFMPIAKKMNQKIVEQYDDIAKINLDESIVSKAIHNFVSNGIKYNREGKTLTITIKKRPKDILMTIVDEGIGIPKSEQANIFKKFYRASNAMSSQTEGTGLGMYIAKSSIELSGGKVWFESVEGKGTTFFVTLPLEGSKAVEGEKSLA
ncbi:MAG: hypothetical protein HY606_03665 [Planctomycetes bacterium]|nr:hypothetical protein [Planctomycetota bacterium]